MAVTIALIGLAILPAIFFYLFTRLNNQIQPLRILLIGLALGSAMLFCNEVINGYPLFKEQAAWIYTTVLVTFIFYLLFELFAFLLGGIEYFKAIMQGRDYKRGV